MSISAGDFGSGASTPLVAATLTATDSGASASTNTVTATLSVSDSGVSSDGHDVVIFVPPTLAATAADAGQAASSTDVSADVEPTDSGVATESAFPTLPIVASESGSVASETGTIAFIILASDAGTFAEAAPSVAATLRATPTAGAGSVAFVTGFAPVPILDDSIPLAWDGGDLLYWPSHFDGTFVYSISGNAWTGPLASPPTRTYEGAALFLSDGKLHVWGAGYATKKHQVYDPVGDSWTVMNDLPTIPIPANTFYENEEFEQIRAVIGSDGFVYLVLSQLTDPSTLLTTGRTLRYDLAGDSYTELAVIPDGGWGALGADELGHLYYFMGWENTTTPSGAVYRYTIGVDAWDTMTAVDPAPTEDFALAYVAGVFYLVGGDDATVASVNGRVRGYDTSSDSFILFDVVQPHPRSDMGWAQVDTRLWMVSGWDNSDDTDLLDFLTISPADGLVFYGPCEDFGNAAEQALAAPLVVAGSGVSDALFHRWVFIDPGGALPQYEFEINPNKMSDPTRKKETTSLGVSPLAVEGFGHHSRAWRVNRLAPRQWTFSGITTSQDQQDKFVQWFGLNRKIFVRDHFGRVWEVRLTKYDAQPRKPSAKNVLWRFQYTFTANVYRRVS